MHVVSAGYFIIIGCQNMGTFTCHTASSVFSVCAESPNRAGENPDNACAICYTSVGKVNAGVWLWVGVAEHTARVMVL